MHNIKYIEAQIALGFYAGIYYTVFTHSTGSYRHYIVKFSSGKRNVTSFELEFDCSDQPSFDKLEKIMLEQNKM